jgi:hypothetical protein
LHISVKYIGYGNELEAKKKQTKALELKKRVLMLKKEIAYDKIINEKLEESVSLNSTRLLKQSGVFSVYREESMLTSRSAKSECIDNDAHSIIDKKHYQIESIEDKDADLAFENVETRAAQKRYEHLLKITENVNDINPENTLTLPLPLSSRSNETNFSMKSPYSIRPHSKSEETLTTEKDLNSLQELIFFYSSTK